MNKILSKLNPFFLIAFSTIFMMASPEKAMAGCKNSEPVAVVQKRVNGMHGSILAKQIIFRCEDGSSGVGLYLNYVDDAGGLIHKVRTYFKPNNFAYWIKINQAELSHNDLLLASDPEYWRNATWDLNACLSAPVTNGDLGQNCSPHQTGSQQAVLFKNVIGDRILPWDIEIAVAYVATNEWDNNGGPNHNFRIHFDQNSLKNPHGGGDEL